MAYRDLREWLKALEKGGELKRIKKETDWNLEVGAITRRVYDLRAPAPLFEKIKGYPEGYRILGAPIGLSAVNKYARIALAMDMPVDSQVRDLVEEYIKRKKNPLKPVLVAHGPCHENVYMRDEVDLFKLPAPLIHQGDGGRYISTWHAVISKDPDTGWVNYGMYRQMIHERNKLGLSASHPKDFASQLQKYNQREQRMEVAVALGTEPITPIVAATAVGVGVNEVDIIGALRMEPLELTKCKTVDLYVPATAEIVFEGYVDAKERRPEGPFGEYTGYNAGGVIENLVFNVTAITYRHQPILPMSCMGVPVDDSHVVFTIAGSAEILEELRDKRGFPVEFVHTLPEGVAHITVVSTKVPYKSYVRHMAMALWGSQAGRFSTILLVVDDDVDITDTTQILWALATRVHPDRGIWKVPHTYTSRLIPWLEPEEKKYMEGARVLLDGTWPYDWPSEWIPQVSSFTTLWPKETQDRVLKNWKEYGY